MNKIESAIKDMIKAEVVHHVYEETRQQRIENTKMRTRIRTLERKQDYVNAKLEEHAANIGHLREQINLLKYNSARCHTTMSANDQTNSRFADGGAGFKEEDPDKTWEPTRHGELWSGEEEAVLKGMLMSAIKKVAKDSRRTVSAVQIKARKVGLI